jgi:hypothetical protein
MPLFAWACLLTIFVVRLCFKLCMGVDKRHRFAHVNSLVATGVVVQRVLYLYMTRSTLDVFNCSPSDPPDYDAEGNMVQYMAWNLSIVCNKPGGTHLFLLPVAAFALAQVEGVRMALAGQEILAARHVRLEESHVRRARVEHHHHARLYRRQRVVDHLRCHRRSAYVPLTSVSCLLSFLETR